MSLGTKAIPSGFRARRDRRGEGIYKLAQAFAGLGDKASALHMLRHNIGGGFFCYPYFVRDPPLQSLREEPEFQALLNQSRDRHEQFLGTNRLIPDL